MRIAAVTAGLSVVGGIFGTIVGTLVLIAWQLPGGELSLSWRSLQGLLFLGVFFGGSAGALLGPLAGWGLMRHVPLWLAVGGTTLGTFAGGALTLALTGSPGLAIMAGVVGFMATAAALRDRFDPEFAD